MVSDEKLQELKSEFRPSYYTAVSNCCFEIFVLQGNKNKVSELDLSKAQYEKVIEDAHEWFMTHFFDEFNAPEY